MVFLRHHKLYKSYSILSNVLHFILKLYIFDNIQLVYYSTLIFVMLLRGRASTMRGRASTIASSSFSYSYLYAWVLPSPFSTFYNYYYSFTITAGNIGNNACLITIWEETASPPLLLSVSNSQGENPGEDSGRITPTPKQCVHLFLEEILLTTPIVYQLPLCTCKWYYILFHSWVIVY